MISVSSSSSYCLQYALHMRSIIYCFGGVCAAASTILVVAIAKCWSYDSSSFVSFTQCSPTCRRMPLPSLSLWPGRQPYTPRLVGGMRGGGPSYVAPGSRNPPTGHRRDSPISSSLFSHGQPLCAVGRQQSQSSPDPAGKDSATSSPILTDDGTSVRLSFQSCSLLLLADESSGVTVRMKLFRDFNLLAAGWWWKVVEVMIKIGIKGSTRDSS